MGSVPVINQRVKTGDKELTEGHSFSGTCSNQGLQVVTTDSESTARGASDLHYIASLVANSFSERLDQVDVNKKNDEAGKSRVGQSLPVTIKTDVEKMVKKNKNDGGKNVQILDANNNCKLDLFTI